MEWKGFLMEWSPKLRKLWEPFQSNLMKLWRPFLSNPNPSHGRYGDHFHRMKSMEALGTTPIKLNLIYGGYGDRSIPVSSMEAMAPIQSNLWSVWGPWSATWVLRRCTMSATCVKFWMKHYLWGPFLSNRIYGNYGGHSCPIYASSGGLYIPTETMEAMGTTPIKLNPIAAFFNWWITEIVSLFYRCSKTLNSRFIIEFYPREARILLFYLFNYFLFCSIRFRTTSFGPTSSARSAVYFLGTNVFMLFYVIKAPRAARFFFEFNLFYLFRWKTLNLKENNVSFRILKLF